MKKFARVSVLLALVAATALPLSAEDKEKKKGEKKQSSAAAGLLKKLEPAGLSAEQLQKIEDIAASFAPKIEEAHKKMAAVVPAEQKQTAAAAVKKAKEEGLQGEALKAAVAKASQLTDAPQKSQIEEAQQAAKAIHSELHAAVFAVLSDEQKAKLQPEKKPGAKKGDSPKKDAPKKDAPKKDAPKKDAPKKEKDAPKKEKDTPKKEQDAAKKDVE